MAPVMFMALFVLIEASRVVMVQQTVTNAAREGARKASLATTQQASDVEATIRDQLKPAIAAATDTTKVKVSVAPNSLSNIASDTTVTVGVRVKFSDVTWLPGSWFAKNLEISAQSSKSRE